MCCQPNTGTGTASTNDARWTDQGVTDASTLLRRPGSGIPDHRWSGRTLAKKGWPGRPWAAAAGSAPRWSVDAWATPWFILTGGQQHDITQLIAGYAGEHVLADKGYDAQEFRRHILELGMMPVIPPRSMTGICTGSVIWSNASSTRSSTIAGSSPGLRSWTPDTWASCTSPPLSSGYGEMSTEPSHFQTKWGLSSSDVRTMQTC